MFEILKYKHVSRDKTFLEVAKELFNGFYKTIKEVQPTLLFFHDDDNLVVLITASSEFLRAVHSNKKLGLSSIDADHIIKSELRKAALSYIEQENPDEYIFFTEVWMKTMNIVDEEKFKKNYSPGNLARDTQSEDGVIIHYENSERFETTMYKVKRKYEEGKTLELYKTITNTDDGIKSFSGNFSNFLYKPENRQ